MKFGLGNVVISKKVKEHVGILELAKAIETYESLAKIELNSSLSKKKGTDIFEIVDGHLKAIEDYSSNYSYEMQFYKGSELYFVICTDKNYTTTSVLTALEYLQLKIETFADEMLTYQDIEILKRLLDENMSRGMATRRKVKVIYKKIDEIEQIKLEYDRLIGVNK